MKFIQPSENICCQDLIQCIYDLNNLDINVYNKLKKQGPKRADELAETLNKERSTIYRSLQKLTCAGLCIKQTETIKQGGYYHIYKINNTKSTKKQIEKCIDNWYNKMKKTLEDLESEL